MVATRYTIRRAGAGDLPGVAACLAAAFEPYRSLYTPGAFNDTVPDVDGVRRRLESMTILCAAGDAGQIIGTIACGMTAPDEGHLRGMAVLPEFHGLGVAESLLAAAEGELRARLCSRVTLDTTRPLVRATRFYTKHGYERTGRVQDFHGMPLHEYEKEL